MTQDNSRSNDPKSTYIDGPVVGTPQVPNRQGSTQIYNDGTQETNQGSGITLKATQYGYPDDPDGDTLTEEGWGAWGNKLTPTSCALTDSARSLLQVMPRGKLTLTWQDGKKEVRFFDDRAPEIDPRIDLYMPYGFDKTKPDTVKVTIA